MIKVTGITLVLALVVLAIIALMVSPILHPFAIGIWKHWPGLTMLALTVSGVILYYSGRPGIGVPLIVIFGLLWLIGGLLGTLWKYETYLANTQVEQLSAEPETTGYRFLPLEVAKTTATNKTTDPQVTPTNPEPLVAGNEATWIVPEEPNNFTTKYLGRQPGFLTVNTTADTKRDTTEFAPGFGLCCFTGRSLTWSSVKRHFWADYSPESYMTNLNGETVIVQPYLSYYLDFSHILPVMVPEYDGVLIFHADGTSDDLTAEEAASKYPGGRFFPHEMATYFATSYQLKNGLWNYLFTHQDQPDVPHLGSQDDKNSNEFPFLIPTKNGPSWYTAVEPYGASKSAYMSYYIDATTGTVQVYKFTEPLVGPDRAETFVNNAFNTLKGTSFYEPRPLVKGGNLYWMLSASASGTPDVQFTALVDAYSEDVIKLDNQQAVERVVNGEDPHKVGEVITSSGTTPQTSGESTTSSTSASGTSDLSNLTDQQLAQMLREAANRLEKEGK
ncbi:MAG: hypothetical protein JOZ19_05715 [Rubrobacter sp.]|nr:hypothetical protein [Rubrobacter sp.]